jgi:phosphatidate cytidylyltransferase
LARVASATVLLVALFVTIWMLPYWATAVLAAVTSAVAGGEVARMAGRVGATVPVAFVGLASALLTITFVFYERQAPGTADDLLGGVILALIVVSGVIVLAIGPPSPQSFGRATTLVMAPVYVGLPLGAIVWVQSAFGPAATSWLLGVIAFSDSAQYYSGRAFGRRKLAPAVSPAKTVEGAVGGLIVAGLAGAILARWCLPVAPLAAGGLALMLAVSGIAGDLFESLLKRSVGVKDSSQLIPGHGGLLDRIDSYLFAAPVFYLFLRYVA